MQGALVLKRAWLAKVRFKGLNSVWAQGDPKEGETGLLAAVYCIKRNNVAILVATGRKLSDVELATNLMKKFWGKL